MHTNFAEMIAKLGVREVVTPPHHQQITIECDENTILIPRTSSPRRSFFKHLDTVQETYYEHFKYVMYFSWSSFKAAFYFSIHAFLPNLFQSSGSSVIYELHEILIKRSTVPPPHYANDT